MSASLVAKNGSFYLKGEKIVLLSGAVHYFRVVPEYWSERLKQVKFCGLNCVETLVVDRFKAFVIRFYPVISF